MVRNYKINLILLSIFLFGGCAHSVGKNAKLPTSQQTQELSALHATHFRSKRYGVTIYCSMCNLKKDSPVVTNIK